MAGAGRWHPSGPQVFRTPALHLECVFHLSVHCSVFLVIPLLLFSRSTLPIAHLLTINQKHSLIIASIFLISLSSHWKETRVWFIWQSVSLPAMTFLRKMWTNVCLFIPGWTLVSDERHNSSLMNQWIYWGYLQNHEWGVTHRSMSNSKSLASQKESTSPGTTGNDSHNLSQFISISINHGTPQGSPVAIGKGLAERSKWLDSWVRVCLPFPLSLL